MKKNNDITEDVQNSEEEVKSIDVASLLTFSNEIKKATIKNKEHEYVEVLIENSIVDYIYKDDNKWTIFYDSESDQVTYAIQFENLKLAKNFITNNLKKIIEKEMVLEETQDDVQG